MKRFLGLSKERYVRISSILVLGLAVMLFGYGILHQSNEATAQSTLASTEFSAVDDNNAEVSNLRAHEDAYITYHENELQVKYGVQSEIEIGVVGNLRGAHVRNWEILESTLPPGFELIVYENPEDYNYAIITGVPQFLGEWCFTIAALLERPVSRAQRVFSQVNDRLCFYAEDNQKRKPHFGKEQLDAGVRGENYYDFINGQAADNSRRIEVFVEWHNLPNSLRIIKTRETIRIRGTPTDRHSYHVDKNNRSANPPLTLGEFTTVRAPISQFNYRDEGEYTYRLTGVYEDGESRSNFVRIVNVRAGEIVKGVLEYEHEPIYINVFRQNGSGKYRFIHRLNPLGSGKIHTIDMNFTRPSIMKAAGVFYLNLSVYDNYSGEISYRQFAVRIREEDKKNTYNCPPGYYYSKTLGYCINSSNVSCQQGYYYSPYTNKCIRYRTSSNCRVGYYYDHFLGYCVRLGYPRCPYNMEWSNYAQQCVMRSRICPFGYSYNWFFGCVRRADYRMCAVGKYYDYDSKRCVRISRACRAGFYWDRHTGKCRRSRRNCAAGYYWSPRHNQCVRHTGRRCAVNYRYDHRLGRCTRVGREGRCSSGYRYDHRRGRCVLSRHVPTVRPRRDRPPRRNPRPTATPTRSRSPRSTARPTRTRSPRSTARPTRTRSPRSTARPTRSRSPRSTARPTRTRSPRSTARPTRSRSPRSTARPTRTRSPRSTARPTRSRSPRSTARPTRTRSPRSTARPTRRDPRPTATPTRSRSPRSTARPTRTRSPRSTTRPTSRRSPRSTARPTSRRSPRPTATPTRTRSPRSTARPTRTRSPRSTARPTRTRSPRSTARPTRTRSPRSTTRPTSRRRPTPRPTASPSPGTGA